MCVCFWVLHPFSFLEFSLLRRSRDEFRWCLPRRPHRLDPSSTPPRNPSSAVRPGGSAQLFTRSPPPIRVAWLTAPPEGGLGPLGGLALGKSLPLRQLTWSSDTRFRVFFTLIRLSFRAPLPQLHGPDLLPYGDWWGKRNPSYSCRTAPRSQHLALLSGGGPGTLERPSGGGRLGEAG